MHSICSFYGVLTVLSGLVVACQPMVTMRDATPFDFGSIDRGNDGGLMTDAVGVDRVGLDRYAASDLDHSDVSMQRDIATSDGGISPVLDAARREVAVPPPGTQNCQVWTDCAPHYNNPNSGYDCSNNLCVCDATHQWASNCVNISGYWLAQECYCVTYADVPPPTQDAGDDEQCWWTWEQDPCEPDYWVDTSYYEEQCYCCDNDGYDICDQVWVADGYWEDGYCPDGNWVQTCY